MCDVSPTSELGDWRSVEPAEAATLFDRLAVKWWIAGGWALDMFLDETSRTHGDLDVGVLRRDIRSVLHELSGWEWCEARDGVLTRLPIGIPPRSDVNSLWCRPVGTAPWVFELMLDESDGALWLFRREPAIKRPLSMLTRTSSSGIPYLAPEIQLLYKAKTLRPHDQADFDRVAPRLDTAAREWLRDSLARTSLRHPWIAALADGRR
jgi:hypothetical protein